MDNSKKTPLFEASVVNNKEVEKELETQLEDFESFLKKMRDERRFCLAPTRTTLQKQTEAPTP